MFGAKFAGEMARMKKWLGILLVLAGLFAGTAAKAQNAEGEFAVFSSITRYLSQGDVNSLSTWFAENMDVTVISSTRSCSKKQAREILRSFFSANTPRSFEVTHRASETNKKYLIGQLNAGGELFQVTIYATSSGQETYKIQQLNISRQTAAY